MPRKKTNNQAEPAKLLLLTDNSQRAKYIALAFLKNAKKIKDPRWGLQYEGFYRDQKVIVRPVTTGHTSQSIFIQEMVHQGIEKIIRLGLAVSLRKNIKVGDVIVVQSVYSEQEDQQAAVRSSMTQEKLKKIAQEIAPAYRVNAHLGSILSSEKYDPYRKTSELWFVPDNWENWLSKVLGVDGNKNELYKLGKEYGFQALSLLVVSDSVIGPKQKPMSMEQRVKTPTLSIKFALHVLTQK